MTESEQRLKRIEILLESGIKLAVSNREDIKALAQQSEQDRANIEALRQQSQDSQLERIELRQYMASLSEMFAESIGIIKTMQSDIKTMQSDIKVMQSEIRGLQTENKRMLDHFFGEDEN